jgi:DNA polymerase-3 subunit alpha
MSFIHLHSHSEYSLLEASCRVKGIAKKAAEYGMTAAALTDNGNMFGAIEFYFSCIDKQIKPIIGLDAYIAPNSRFARGQDRNEIQRPNTRLVLLAQNIEGYRNLCQLSSIGYQEGFYYKPRIDYEVIQKFNSDLICLSGGLRGEVAHTLLTEGKDAAVLKVKNLLQIFGDRFYLELNRTGVNEWTQINSFLQEIGEQLGIKTVAANDVHYLEQDDQMAQEVLICIGTNKTLQDDSRYRLGTNQFYFKKPEQMRELFRDIPEACDHTLEIADRCQVKFKLKDETGKPVYHLPSFPTQDGRTVKEEIKVLSEAGIARRFDEAAKQGTVVPDEKKPEYYKRLEYELSIIDRMGFNGYFLIVMDFIRWAKENGIPVGPGRGSGAGSLVAYSLRITDLDPIPNFLLFERFLNPERISMPDFDIDFCQDRRGEVIRYVTEKYGMGSVSQIITYGKLQTRAAIKDVGRVLGMTFPEVDAVTKLIPDKLNITLKESLEMEPRLRELMELNPQVNTLIELAQRVEGMVRHAGIHAAGVIIADGELVRHAPLYKGAEGENVVQYDMKHAEKIGLIKFDFLGLKTLTHIRNALDLVEKNRGKKILENEIPINDGPTFELMARGDTAGVFQFEGEGITDATRKIKPSHFGDVTAITSLYRPGPMANIPEFTKRKHGEGAIDILIEDTREILNETYGIMVYQEQVMGIAARVAGYSLGESDMLRRAMGKKIKEEMDQHRIRFLKGAKDRGHDEKKSEELFELMYKFADYGFNKSHAAAYSVITLQTAWIKNYFPAEFYAALLTTELSDTDKIVKYSKDAQKRGLKVLPPHISVSEYRFTVKGDDIYFGLGAIKGVGESVINVITEAREKLPDKKFSNIEEFFESVDPRKINKKVVECLIKAGAFDGFGAHRAQLMAGYQKFLDRAGEVRKEREIGQSSLFDLGGADEAKVELQAVMPWTRSAQLAFEKEVLGFYLSDHPLKGFENLSKVWVTCSVIELPRVGEEFAKALAASESSSGKPEVKRWDPKNRDAGKKRIVVAGLITEMRELITKKGTRMAFAKVEDLSGACELVIFPDTFSKIGILLKDERPQLIGGILEVNEGVAKIIVDSVSPLEDVLKKTKSLTLHLERLQESEYAKVYQLLAENPGQTKVAVTMKLEELGRTVLIEPETLTGVAISNELFENLHSQLGRTDFIEMK